MSPEERVQAGIVKMLRDFYPTVEVHFCGNTRVGSLNARRIRKGLGSRAGWPDLCVLGTEGRTLWVEVKAPKSAELGTKRQTPLSKEQKLLLPKLKSWGHRVIVATSTREVSEALRSIGIRPGLPLVDNPDF